MGNDCGAGGGLVDGVADWVVSEALGKTRIDTLLQGCCDRLCSAGIPLLRVSLAFPTLHPLFAAVTHIWRRWEDEIERDEHRHGTGTSPEWKRSPFYHMQKVQVPFLRRRLTGPDAVIDFPILDDLLEVGATDYLAYMVGFGHFTENEAPRDGIIVSWTTDRPGGFTDSDIQALMRIQRRLAVACKVMIREEITHNILTAYLGPDAGQQVLEGNIQLGDGTTTHAVIWFSDLRNSTTMADTLPPEEFLATLNAYFECTAGAVLAQGGEVLRFVGDAVLAIFAIRGGKAAARSACRKAIRAAGEAAKRQAVLNKLRASEGKPPLAYGIGLHVGDVHYGNIGVPERVEFSVVGPAANEASRLQALTKALGEPVLVSGEVAARLDLDWRPMGRHELRGVGDPLEVFAPPAPDAELRRARRRAAAAAR